MDYEKLCNWFLSERSEGQNIDRQKPIVGGTIYDIKVGKHVSVSTLNPQTSMYSYKMF